MNELRNELITAIQEVSMSTGTSTEECIRQAMKILQEEQTKYDYVERAGRSMFGKWNE